MIKKKIEEENMTLYTKETKGKICWLCSIANEDFLKIVFISKRKGNNDLIPRKHAYNITLESLPSWKPSAELFSKTFLYPAPFLKDWGGGCLSSLHLTNPHVVSVKGSSREDFCRFHQSSRQTMEV